MGHGIAPNPSWGDGTRLELKDNLIVVYAPNPSWGDGTWGVWASAAGCSTPNPSWGDGTLTHPGMCPYSDNLLTPHGVTGRFKGGSNVCVVHVS